MSPSLEQMKVTLSGFSTSERAELAEYLLRSLDSDGDDVKAEWFALAEQRMVDVRAGRVSGIPAKEVL